MAILHIQFIAKYQFKKKGIQCILEEFSGVLGYPETSRFNNSRHNSNIKNACVKHVFVFKNNTGNKQLIKNIAIHEVWKSDRGVKSWLGGSQENIENAHSYY